MSTDWQKNVRRELTAGKAAHKANLEGRSRVCARRAAGYAVREYFQCSNWQGQTTNYYQLLLRFSELPTLPDNIRLIAEHLCRRVDEDYSLPANINLVAETEILIKYLAEQIRFLNQ